MPDRDIAKDILRRVAEACPAITPELAAKIENELRRDWAGDRPYIRSHNDFPQRKAAAKQDLARGVPVAEVQRRHGISRSTIYVLLRGRR